jgi:hypothetical protein
MGSQTFTSSGVFTAPAGGSITLMFQVFGITESDVKVAVIAS